MSSNGVATVTAKPVFGGNGANNEEYYRYKARKYHYKCQNKLKLMQTAGKVVPQEYEQYLRPFEG